MKKLLFLLLFSSLSVTSPLTDIKTFLKQYHKEVIWSSAAVLTIADTIVITYLSYKVHALSKELQKFKDLQKHLPVSDDEFNEKKKYENQ